MRRFAKDVILIVGVLLLIFFWQGSMHENVKTISNKNQNVIITFNPALAAKDINGRPFFFERAQLLGFPFVYGVVEEVGADFIRIAEEPSGFGGTQASVSINGNTTIEEVLLKPNEDLFNALNQKAWEASAHKDELLEGLYTARRRLSLGAIHSGDFIIAYPIFGRTGGTHGAAESVVRIVPNRF